LARLPGAEIATMAGSKKKSKKEQARAKAVKKGPGPRKSPKKAAKPAPKASSAKKAVAKHSVVRNPQRAASPPVPPRPPKPFADRVRNCDAGTAIWFMVAGGIEHAVIQKRVGDGVMIVTDAGVTELVSPRNLFETAEEARAARYR
jgi:hypothetical protein